MVLLKILRKTKIKEKELRLLVLGLDNAGKTTVVKRLRGEDTSTISPTVGFEISTLETRDLKLNIWDVGGQKVIRSFWRNYFERTDGLLWVVDSADSERLDECKIELEKLLREERLAGATLIVLANKQDLPGALSADAIKEKLKLELIKSRHWSIQPYSMHSEIGGSALEEGMDWLVDDISGRIFVGA